MIFPNYYNFEKKEDFDSNYKGLKKVPMLSFTDKGVSVVIENGKVVMSKNESEKIQMYIQMLLRTRLDKYGVYSDFGVAFYNLLENISSIGLLSSEIQREVKEKLTKFDSVSEVVDFKTKRNGTLINTSFKIIMKDESVISINEVI